MFYNLGVYQQVLHSLGFWVLCMCLAGARHAGVGALSRRRLRLSRVYDGRLEGEVLHDPVSVLHHFVCHADDPAQDPVGADVIGQMSR